MEVGRQTAAHRHAPEALLRWFLILVVLGAIPHWLFVQGKRYGAAEQLACSDHCTAVAVEHPGQGGRGVLDAQADRCECAGGEPLEVAGFDVGDGRTR